MKSKKKKKKKKVLTSFSNVFLLPFPIFHLFFSIFTPFPFFPCLFSPDTSEISRSEVSGGHSAPLPPACYATAPTVILNPTLHTSAYYAILLPWLVTNFSTSGSLFLNLYTSSHPYPYPYPFLFCCSSCCCCNCFFFFFLLLFLFCLIVCLVVFCLFFQIVYASSQNNNEIYHSKKVQSMRKLC